MSKSDLSDKKVLIRRLPSVSTLALSSDFPVSPGCFRRRFLPSPSPFRFGEAVFTEDVRDPQEEKSTAVRFFSKKSETFMKTRGWRNLLKVWAAFGARKFRP